jgi:DNA-binding NarL/FixJ family response regulator
VNEAALMHDVIRTVVADDHAVVRQGMRRLPEFEPSIRIEAEASDGLEALQLCRTLRPNLLITDITMPGLNGLELTRQLKAEMPYLAVVVLTVYDDATHVAAAMRAGASAYCPKDADLDVLVEAILVACRGGSFVPPDIEARIRDMNVLTPREVEVLQLVAPGLSNREIGQRLHISDKTVRNHLSSIFEKLGVDDRIQAALYAYQRGWVTEAPLLSRPEDEA